MPLRLIPIKKHKPAGTFSTRKRVIEGLKAAATTIWANNVTRLPTSTAVYTQAIRAIENKKRGQPNSLYPSAKAVLNHFETMNHAWWAIGHEVKTLTRLKLHRIMTPTIHEKLEYIYRFQGVKKTDRPADAPTLRDYAAQLTKELEARGLRVDIRKLDPYLNVDAGTMSPYEHGETFVTDDGTETDLDLERFAVCGIEFVAVAMAFLYVERFVYLAGDTAGSETARVAAESHCAAQVFDASEVA
jgi:hypothetical protein